MTRSEFLKIKEFEYDEDLSVLNVGDIFIMGEGVIDQKSNMNDISVVSYYKVIDIKDNIVSYTTEMEKLED